MGSLGCSDHEIVEFSIEGRGSRTESKISNRDSRRTNFSIFRDLLRRIPWEKALKGRGFQERWSIFKDHFFRAQGQCIPKIIL